MRTIARAEPGRHVIHHGGRDDHLLVAGRHLRQPRPATGIQLGEDVVEDQHGSPARDSARSSSADASRRASATDHDSPWEA